MEGDIEWSAVPLMAEMLGCDDLDGLTAGLVAIRAHRNEKLEHERASPNPNN